MVHARPELIAKKARTFVSHSPPPRRRPPLGARLVQSALRAVATVAPGPMERLAASLFTRPRRVRPPAPAVPGLVAHRFRMRAGPHELEVTEWGEGPTVLLVHGWNGHAGQMTSMVEPLVRAGHHVVTFNQPGHGGVGARHVTVLDMRDAVLAVAQRLAPVQAIVAHSLGATASALAMAAGLTVARVALIAPPSEAPYYARRLGRALGLGPAQVQGMVERVGREVGGDLDAIDLLRIAPHLRARALVIHDPADREVPFAQGAAIASAWPRARLVEAPGLGHTRVLGSAEIIDGIVRFVSR